MFSKFIITLLVIVAAFTVIRSRNASKTAPKGSKAGIVKSGSARPSELSTDIKIGAYLFLALSIGIGGSVYYFQWQEDHTILTVNLYRDSQLEPVSYRVYKYQLEDKAFVTIDGLSVAVAGSERMEVLGLD